MGREREGGRDIYPLDGSLRPLSWELSLCGDFTLTLLLLSQFIVERERERQRGTETPALLSSSRFLAADDVCESDVYQQDQVDITSGRLTLRRLAASPLAGMNVATLLCFADWKPPEGKHDGHSIRIDAAYARRHPAG